MPDYQLLVGGVDHTADVERRSIVRDQSLDGKADLLNFTARNGWRPLEGQEVILTVLGERLFAGEVRRVGDNDPLNQQGRPVTCADWLPRFDRHMVWASYAGLAAGAIVRDLVADYAPEFTVAGVQDGPIIESISWQGARLSQCMAELAELAGFFWRPDYLKDITFAARTTLSGPYALTDAGGSYSRLTAVTDKTRLVTRVVVGGGRDITDPQNYAFRGDGSTRSFGPFTLPLAAQPTVLVNGVAKTIGIKGVDTGKNFYWNENGVAIEQDSGATLLTTADVVSGQYRGYMPYRLEVDDPITIAQVKAIEGGDGVYEDSITVPQETPSSQARLKAIAYLKQFAKVVVNGSFLTFDRRWQAGQLVTIQTTQPALNGQYLVLGVRTSPRPGWDVTGDLRWESTVTFGSTPDDWLQVFEAALRPAGTKLTARANEVIMRLVTMTDQANAAALSDGMSYSTYTFRRCSSTLRCSGGLII